MADQKKQKASKPADHPTYKVMITAALKALGERNGNSLRKCHTYMTEHYNLGPKSNLPTKTAVKRLIQSGYLTQTTGKGANGSFKLSAASKESEKSKEKAAKQKQKAAAAKVKAAGKPKKPKSAKKTSTKKATTPKKTAKKTTVKKTTTKKTAQKKTTKKVTAKKPAAKKSPKKKTAAKKTGAKKAAKK